MFHLFGLYFYTMPEDGRTLTQQQLEYKVQTAAPTSLPVSALSSRLTTTYAML